MYYNILYKLNKILYHTYYISNFRYKRTVVCDGVPVLMTPFTSTTTSGTPTQISGPTCTIRIKITAPVKCLTENCFDNKNAFLSILLNIISTSFLYKFTYQEINILANDELRNSDITESLKIKYKT